jgi:3-oxoacyl-[acyl-carrier protein] reductase/pteridine reductase
LAQAGANIGITFRASEREAADTVRELQALGIRAAAFPCELRDAASVPRAVEAAIRQLGRLDVLVNNAGAYQTREFEKISIEEWDELFAVNVRGPFLMTQACAHELRKQRGRIINIGSLGGLRPWATHVHYCSSKAALHMLTEACAKALAPEVMVNCVAPGLIDQGEPEDPAMLERFATKTPMQRNGSPKDVAEAVMFFATAPDFITGQILTVDGGLSLT